MDVSLTNSVFLRFNYGSNFRSGFDAEQRMLIGERGRIWGLLSKQSNEHIKKLVDTLVLSSPALVSAQAKLKDNPSRQNKIAWRQVVNGLRPAINSEDHVLNKSIAVTLAESGMWWQNKDSLYSDFVRALRTNKNYLLPIRQRRHQDTCGNFTYRFQKPVTIADLEGGKLPVQIVRSGNHVLIRMPIHADGFGKYRMAEWPFTWHRDLPEKCSIRAINVIGRMEGAQWRLTVSFLIEEEILAAPPSKNRLCGVDVGWRLGPTGLRVATAIIDKKVLDFSLPIKWVLAMEYVLQIDQALDVDGLIAWTHAEMPQDYPGWAKAVEILKDSSSEPAQSWLNRSTNIRRERNNKHAKLERQRLNAYRNYAAELVDASDQIHVEKLDLRRLLANDSKQGPNQKRQQRFAAVSILQDCIKHACTRAGKQFKLVEAYSTTAMHLECGFLNSPSQDQLVICKGCGEVYDQDINAAKNIAASKKFK